MAANKSNNSIIISSGSGRESDSGSATDDEPVPKKCKVEEESARLHRPNILMETPIRTATTLLEFSSQRDGIENRNNSATGPPQEEELLNKNIVDQGEECPLLIKVGNIVPETLEVRPRSDSPPREIATTLSDPRTASGTNSDSYNHTQRVSTSPAFYGNLARPNTIASGFPIIAQEVATCTGSGARSALTSSASRRSQLCRVRSRNGTSTRGGNATTQENNNDNSSHGLSTLSSFSSASSSEYFTDDIDPMEIPSDEYISPPYPTRQRRNAIFIRRETPPSELDQNEDDQYYQNELEVASVLDISENPIEDGSSTSGTDEEVLRRSHSCLASLVLPPEETDNHFADNENVKSDGNSESTEQATNITGGQKVSQSDTAEKDKWLCSKCKAEKTSPCYRYCLRCFKIRRTWLPPRPTSTRRKNKKALLRTTTSNPNSLNNSITSRITMSSVTSASGYVVDGHHAGSQNVLTSSTPLDTLPGLSLEVHQSLPCTQQVDMNNGFLIDDNNPSTNLMSSESSPGNLTILELFAMPETSSEIRRRFETTVAGDEGFLNSQISTARLASTQSSSSLSPTKRLSSSVSNRLTGIVPALSSKCSICYVRDKDAAFVHNKIAHLYCCYSCADKTLKKNGKCPICRERVLRVVKIIGV